MLVQKAEAVTKTSSGILIPEKSVAKVLTGKVVAVGEGQRTDVSISDSGSSTIYLYSCYEYSYKSLLFYYLEPELKGSPKQGYSFSII